MGATLNARVALGILFTAIISDAPANPYLPIVDRNVFGLREPPPPQPPAPQAPVAEDNAELMLTGVVDFRLGRWALITRTERGKTTRAYTLSVGEREDNLELLDIDIDAGTVRLRHGAAEVLLSFNKNQPSIEDLGRKYVQQAKPFVDAHVSAHALRERREAQRRELERAAAEAELMSRQISTHLDEPRLPLP